MIKKSFKILVLGVFAAVCIFIGFTNASASKKIPFGEQLFLKNKCNKCHTIKALGIKKLPSKENQMLQNLGPLAGLVKKKKGIKPPDLSGVGKVRSAKWINDWLAHKIRLHGKHHKKKLDISARLRWILAKWVSTLKYKTNVNYKK
ncbi:MAG: c-type cytochrome [Firmicutes bacterium]|nr:c-type cytochrome [Bacillota bacterium]